jgi:hypothetical protein
MIHVLRRSRYGPNFYMLARNSFEAKIVNCFLRLRACVYEQPRSRGEATVEQVLRT